MIYTYILDPHMLMLLLYMCVFVSMCSDVSSNDDLYAGSVIETFPANTSLLSVQTYEGGIEKSVPRITDWHHEACRVMTISDCEGRIFLSHPHIHDRYFFLLTTKHLIFYWKDVKRLPETPKFTW